MTARAPAGPLSPDTAEPASETAGRTLDRLASERATGALHGCAGALYLADGAVVHAESPAVPDLGRRLTARGRLSPQAWEEAVAEGGPGYRAGSLLVERGRLSRGELELCHLSALFDAAYFVLSPLGPGLRAPDRFLGGARHWLGPIRPVPVPLLRREVVRRRRLLERAWPRPEVDAAPVVRTSDGGAGPAQATGRRAVLAAADGVRTPVQIARDLGRPAFATLLDVRRLAAAGLVRTPCADTPTAPVPPPPAAPELSLLYRIRDALEAL
ncbi:MULTISPECIES: transcriptional regulator [Streptomyces]|uniref:transcriptional regulator n=1 Tax=Streptomyces TaxID=1883 RepID=UPI001E5D33CA|nr:MULTISPECIES: transcriptional regulator [Streptomyces]